MSAKRRRIQRSPIARTGCFHFNAVSAGSVRRGVDLDDAIEHGAEFVASTIDGAKEVIHGLPQSFTLVFDFPFGEQIAYGVKQNRDQLMTREDMCVSILKMSLAVLDNEGWPSDGLILMGAHVASHPSHGDGYLLEFARAKERFEPGTMADVG